MADKTSRVAADFNEVLLGEVLTECEA
jgi:hypothetical protein